MKMSLKYLAILLIIFLLLFCAALFTGSKYSSEFDTISLFNLSVSFAIASTGGLIIFFRGVSKEPRERTMHTFTAISVKFIAELFIALAWFVVSKKTERSCIILFFVLYLTFSLYFIFVIINTLKNKSL